MKPQEKAAIRDLGREKGRDLEREKGLVQADVIELKEKIGELERAKRQAQDEVLQWKVKYEQLEAQEKKVAGEYSHLVDIVRMEREKILKLEVDYNNIAFAKIRAQEEVQEWKGKYGELEARKSRLREETSRLIEEEKFVEVAVKSGNLGSEKRRAQAEVHEWKRKYGEMECQAMRLGEENSRLIEVERTEREFNEALEVVNRDLESAKRRAESEVLELRRKNEELDSRGLTLVEGGSCLVENEKGEGEFKETLINELLLRRSAHFVQKSPEEVSPLSSKKRRKHAFDGDNEDENGVDNYGEEGDGVSPNQKMKRCKHEPDRAKKAFGSSLTRSYGYMTRSRKKVVSFHLSEIGTFADEEVDMQIPLLPANSGHEVADKGVQSYLKSNSSKNQQRQGEYTRRIASYEEQHRAEMRAEKLQSNLNANNPSFVKSVVRSHVSGCFWFGFPTTFWEENLPAHQVTMVLEDEKGLEHKVNYIGDRNRFSGGWRRFALDHNLEVGDALVFELTEPTRFKVYVIKAGQESERGLLMTR